jgi:prepilin-type N-terminal cleavage/methylation domain-containing protein
MRIHSRHRGQSGFSLIEVMIAVIVLATGLLALAALQINLTSSSADAKARSRIAALLVSTIDDERAAGYSTIATYAATSCNSTGTTLQKAICTAESDAGVSGIQVTQTVTHWYGLNGGSTFTTTVPAASAKGYGDYKVVNISAAWTDATGASRSFSTSTIAGTIDLTASSTLLNQILTTTASVTPTVHEQNPANTAGVIPIAVGSNTDTASTNPKPKLTNTLPSTTFTSLTYQGDSGLTTATIQKRVETTVAECVCDSSSSNPFTDTTFLGASTFRPTYWTGNLYVAPDIGKTSGGTTITPYSAADSNVTQDDLCNQCCRDHHDNSNGSDTVKFDPLISAGTTTDYNRYQVNTTLSHGKYTPNTPISLKLVSSNPVAATMDGTAGSSVYLDACRLIRVDGLWRVATDLSLNHMGLIATSPKGFATTSTPDTSAAAAYEDFVLDYIGQEMTFLISGGTAPTVATIFNSHGLNDPTSIDDLSTGTDYRYLHARGLYIDHLETKALTKLTSVNSTCAAANYPACLLPYLPFDTINLTEVANWSPSNAAVVTVTNASTACTTGAPIRGCVSGHSTGTATANVNITTANSGVASSLAVSPYERTVANLQTDSQQFKVTGTNTASEFFVALSGPTTTLNSAGSTTTAVQFWTVDLSTSNDPSVVWGDGVSNINGSDFCFSNFNGRTDTDPDPYDCVTTVLLALPVNVTVGNYNQVVNNTIDNPCAGGTGSVSQPTLICNTVSGASISGVGGSGYTFTNTVSNSKTTSETTLIALTAKNAGTIDPITKSAGTVTVTFSSNGTAAATYTCDATTHVPTFTTPTSCP